MRAIGKTCGMTDHDRRELVETVRYNTGIDWTRREDVARPAAHRGQEASAEHGYLPDKQEKATDTVIKQAEGLTSYRRSYLRRKTQTTA